MRLPLGSAVLDAAARLLVPVILLFAVYVVAHGHDSPGGGFQGGVLFAAGLILVKLTHGGGRWGIGTGAALSLACVGVAGFGGIGLVAVAYGGNYLDYAAPPLLDDPVAERVIGTLGIEIGVALAVAGVILLVFDALAGSGDHETPS